MEIASNKKVGYYIREKRELKGWTAAQLSEKVGVSTVTISRWETGKASVAKENLVSLAEALDVTPMDIMAGKDITEMSMEEKEAIANRFMELEDTSFTLEDRVIMAIDMAKAAIGLAFIALSIAVWGAFPHTTLNLISCCLIFAAGVVFMLFGRAMIKLMERQLAERKEKIK